MSGYRTAVHGLSWTIAKASGGGNLILPKTVPTAINWVYSGRNSTMGNNGGLNTYLLHWGAFFLATGKSVNADVLLKIGPIELYVKTIAGDFARVKRKDLVDMGQYDASFIESTATPATSFAKPGATSRISNMEDGKFLHFFGNQAADQYQIPNTSDVGGIITCFRAKMISASGADLSSQVGSILAQAGADYRLTPEALPAGDAFVSSMVAVQPYDQLFYGSTLRLPQLSGLTLPAGLAQLTDRSYTPGIDPDYQAP